MAELNLVCWGQHVCNVRWIIGTVTLFLPPCGQISMSVSSQACAAQASATTLLETTPASAQWTTCKLTEATTAWVRLPLSRCGFTRGGQSIQALDLHKYRYSKHISKTTYLPPLLQVLKVLCNSCNKASVFIFLLATMKKKLLFCCYWKRPGQWPQSWGIRSDLTKIPFPFV